MRPNRKTTPLRNLRTYGDSRAVRHPDCDYRGRIDVHLTMCAALHDPIRIITRMLNTVFRQIAFCLSLATCLSLCGCGAVFVSRVQCFPDPIHLIIVSDAETGNPLESARVTYRIEPYNNWFEKAGFWVTSKIADPNCVDDPVEYITVTARGNGEFVVKQCRKTGWLQWFFPIPSPLGWNLYREYQAVVITEAAGYYPIMISYLPRSTKGDGTCHAFIEVGDVNGCYGVKPDGTLKIGMCPLPSVNNR